MRRSRPDAYAILGAVYGGSQGAVAGLVAGAVAGSGGGIAAGFVAGGILNFGHRKTIDGATSIHVEEEN